MATTKSVQLKIQALRSEFDRLTPGTESLLAMIDAAEIPEQVYNSNAIENSTLSLKETEKILLDMAVSRHVTVREVFEAKNLARVIEYIRTKSHETELNTPLILLLHQMLMGNIDTAIAGRLRKATEYVQVGTHIAPAPEQIEHMLASALIQYTSDYSSYFIEKIAQFHLAFETIHPFCDGNGRIGRILMCYQLARLGFPNIIIRDKEKPLYFQSFRDYHANTNTKSMEQIVTRALLESLHKRITYLKSDSIVCLSDYAKKQKISTSALINAARRQTIPAFREKGVWKIGESFRRI